MLSVRRTAASDLDIVVVLAGPPAPYRESLQFRGWPAEIFVHDRHSLESFFDRDTARRHPTLARMCVHGAVLGDAAGVAAGVREVLEAGPPSVTRAELDERRYELTGLLADLAGSEDPAETAVIGWNLWVPGTASERVAKATTRLRIDGAL